MFVNNDPHMTNIVRYQISDIRTLPLFFQIRINISMNFNHNKQKPVKHFNIIVSTNCFQYVDPNLSICIIYPIVVYSCGLSKHIKKSFEDTKWVIRICISKKNRLHNDQKKKYKRTNDDLQNIHIKLKIE